MKRFNMKTLSLVSGLSSLVLLMACGDNVTDNDPVTTQAYDSQEDFPECDEAGEGLFALVKSSQDLYICTAGSWMNLTRPGSGSADGKSSCTSEELADKSGVKVVCNGDSVSVLKYGKAGAKGTDGTSGTKGPTGDKGSDGTNGSSGSDAVWDIDRCKLKASGMDVMVYECGDSVYVEKQNKSSKFKTSTPWKGMTYNFVATFEGYTIYTVYNDRFEDAASGNLVRFNGDNSWTKSTSLSSAMLAKAGAKVGGLATVNVTTAQTVTAEKYRPFVGAKFTISSSGVDRTSYGGLCLTYSSEEEMNLLLEGETGFVKASLPATEGKEVVKNVYWTDFAPVAEGADLLKVVSKLKYAYVEGVGSEEVGEYTNDFSVFQFGYYGNCNDFTATTWAASLKTGEGTVTDTRSNGNSAVYKTVTIGTQTWLAENVRYGTEACLVTGDTDCKKHGRKYTWPGALSPSYSCGTTTTCGTLPEKVQGVCPSGYHIATLSDWNTLISTLGTSFGITIYYGSDYSSSYGPIITFAFFRDDESLVSNYARNQLGLGLGYYSAGAHWTAKESSATYGYTFDFDWSMSVSSPIYPYRKEGWAIDKTNTYPVRCVKN